MTGSRALAVPPSWAVTAEADRATWAEAVQLGRQVLVRKARSFSLATAFLPPATQDAVAVVYGFCRLADDLADEVRPASAARRRLDLLEAELLGFAPARPVVAGFRMLAEREGVPLSAARTLLRGVRLDVDDVELADDVALLRYCYRVAATVGLMMNPLLGVRDPAGEAAAVNLGLAMQLTNIVRDVAEDAANGRVYLPASRLAAHGTTPAAVRDGTAPRHAVRAVAHELLAMADTLYRNADQGLAYIPLRARFGITAASRLYASIGWRMQRCAHNPLDGRTVVPRYEKGWRLVQAAGRTLRASFGPSWPGDLGPELQAVRDRACAGA